MYQAIALTPMDFSIICGFRGEESQNRAFRDGNSTKRYPGSWHNYTSKELDVEEGYAQRVGMDLSMAVDAAPFLEGRIRWDLQEEIRWLNGFIIGVGMPMVVPHGFYLRTGVDWDMDGIQHEHQLIDAPHTELRRLP